MKLSKVPDVGLNDPMQQGGLEGSRLRGGMELLPSAI